MEDLRDLFHAYVPELDYKLPPNESDKWYVFLNVCLFLTLIAALLLFALFCKLKHRWLVNAKCAFCNCVVTVWRAKLYWWLCQHCQRINGYPKNSFVQTDSSSLDESQELKNDSVLMNSTDVHNNKVPSLSNQRKRLAFSKNDLNVSTILSHSPKVFHDKENESIVNVQDENHTQIETSFHRIRNRIKGLFSYHDHDTEKLSDNTVDTCSENPNSTSAPVEASDLRKMQKKLFLDDVNRRMELLDTEKKLYAKMKQMKELDKTLREAKRNATRDMTPHSISRRNTCYERPIHHDVGKSSSVLNNNTEMEARNNNTELEIRNNVAAGRLASLEAHLIELRDMEENEIKLLKSQIVNKSRIINKIEDLKLRVVDVNDKAEETQYDGRHFQSSMVRELQFERNSQLQISSSNNTNNNNSESGYLSVEMKNNEMSVIVEEDDNPDQLKQDNEQATAAASASGVSIASQRRHNGGGGRSVAASMVKPTEIRATTHVGQGAADAEQHSAISRTGNQGVTMKKRR